MNLRSAFLVAATVLFAPAWAGGHTPPAGSPLALHQHPRIWITQASLPALRDKLAGPFKSEYQAFVTYLESNDTEHSESVQILNYAFVAAVGVVPGITYGWSYPTAYSDKAKTILLDIVNTVDPGRSDDSYWPAVAYDWLYPYLTVAERGQLWTYTLALNAEQPTYKDPWDDRSSRTTQRRLLAGLAFWGDGIDDAGADGFLNLYQTYVLSGGLLDASNLIAADDGGVSEGFSYATRGGESSSIENLLKIQEGWRTGNGLTRTEVYTSTNALRYFPQWIAYLMRPHAPVSTTSPTGYDYFGYKTHNMDSDQPMTAKATLRTLISALRLYKDIDPTMASLCEWLLQYRLGVVTGSDLDSKERALLGNFVFGEKGIVPLAPTALGLPLTKKFDGLGWVNMRTGWGLTDSMVTFIASPWHRTSYSNYNQNSFTIDRRGPLGLNSGVATHHDYANATWAHNTIIFPDRLATPPDPPDGFDYGGERKSFQPPVTDSTMLTIGSKYDLGGVKRLQVANPAAGLDFDYTFGDATRAYNGPANDDNVSTNAPKVVNFTRQLVYFRPTVPGESDRVVVFDRTETTTTGFEKRWLLHTPWNPQVDGVGTLEREGKWTYTGAGLVTATNTADGSFGKMFSRTLLPEQRRLVKIGGPGHEFENPYGANDPFSGFDPATTLTAQYVGTYRVEVIPTVLSTTDVFLHVVEAADASASAPASTGLLQGVGFVGARVGQRIAMFNRSETVLSGGEFTIDLAGTYRMLLCDLTPGAEYQITSGGVPVTAFASGAGVVYVTATVGVNAKVTVTKTGAQLTPPSAPRNVRFAP